MMPDVTPRKFAPRAITTARRLYATNRARSKVTSSSLPVPRRWLSPKYMSAFVGVSSPLFPSAALVTKGPLLAALSSGAQRSTELELSIIEASGEGRGTGACQVGSETAKAGNGSRIG
jgi:hypothetical protein